MKNAVGELSYKKSQKLTELWGWMQKIIGLVAV